MSPRNPPDSLEQAVWERCIDQRNARATWIRNWEIVESLVNIVSADTLDVVEV